MDGENNGSEPYFQMDELGGFGVIFPYFWFNTYIIRVNMKQESRSTN